MGGWIRTKWSESASFGGDQDQAWARLPIYMFGDLADRYLAVVKVAHIQAHQNRNLRKLIITKETRWAPVLGYRFFLLDNRSAHPLYVDREIKINDIMHDGS